MTVNAFQLELGALKLDDETPSLPDGLFQGIVQGEAQRRGGSVEFNPFSSFLEADLSDALRDALSAQQTPFRDATEKQTRYALLERDGRRTWHRVTAREVSRSFWVLVRDGRDEKPVESSFFTTGVAESAATIGRGLGQSNRIVEGDDVLVTLCVDDVRAKVVGRDYLWVTFRVPLVGGPGVEGDRAYRRWTLPPRTVKV